VQLIKPLTAGLPPGCQAYINLLPPSMVGPVTHFISHTWGGGIEALFEGVIAKAKEREGSDSFFFYFDIASNNQHAIDQVMPPPSWPRRVCACSVRAHACTCVCIRP
jgi:hypothetical protein